MASVNIRSLSRRAAMMYNSRRLLSSKTIFAITLCGSVLLVLTSQLLAPTVLTSLRFPSQQNNEQACNHELGSSSYRRRLSLIRPLDTVQHSKTLGVAGRVYVVSLPTRTDRRELMSKLERAMDIEFTWHNATDYRSKEIRDIRERVRWWRNGHRVSSSLPNKDPSPFVFKWANDVDEWNSDLGLSGSDLWTDTFVPSPLPPLPLPPLPDTRPPVLDTYGENGTHFGDLDIKLAQFSCWHSHYRVLRRIAEGDDNVAIVFEDDIDMEWDLEKRLRTMWQALPKDWDMIMIGHCQSFEWTNPALKGAPTLHPARHTLCTHAYAVTRRAAQRMSRRLRSESFAYSRNIDHAFQHLSSRHHLKVFSIYPPVVVQTYELESDIMPGRSKERSQWLTDSVLERIALAEKEDMSGSIETMG